MTAAVRGLDGSRTIVRRRALPSGRAVTGGFLMALAALGVFVAARGAGQPATQNYVVVAHDVDRRHDARLTADLRGRSARPARRDLAAHAFTEPRQRRSAKSPSPIWRRATSSRPAPWSAATPPTRGCSCRFPSSGRAPSTACSNRASGRRARHVSATGERRHRSSWRVARKSGASTTASRSALTTSDDTVLVLAVDDRRRRARGHPRVAGRQGHRRPRHRRARARTRTSSYQPPHGLTMAHGERYVALGLAHARSSVVQRSRRDGARPPRFRSSSSSA